ncbi:MAG: hypothetical protein QM687_12385 [Ferruginibacter sp.]
MNKTSAILQSSGFGSGQDEYKMPKQRQALLVARPFLTPYNAKRT